MNSLEKSAQKRKTVETAKKDYILILKPDEIETGDDALKRILDNLFDELRGMGIADGPTLDDLKFLVSDFLDAFGDDISPEGYYHEFYEEIL